MLESPPAGCCWVMQCSAPRPQIRSTRVNADDLAVRKNFSQSVQRHAVVGIVEGGNKHQPVGDVEIRVAGRQACPKEDDRTRKGQLDEVNCLPSRVRAALSRARFSLSGAWLGSLAFGSTAATIVVGADETRNVVHVAVGVVAGDAAIEPNDLIDAEKIRENLLQLLAAHARVALLHLAQQTFLGRQQSSRAIHVDRPAFKHAALRTVLVLDERLPMRESRAALPRGPAACRRDASRSTWPSR